MLYWVVIIFWLKTKEMVKEYFWKWNRFESKIAQKSDDKLFVKLILNSV